MSLVSIKFVYNDEFTEFCESCNKEGKKTKAVFHVTFPKVPGLEDGANGFLCNDHGTELIRDSRSYKDMIHAICN